MQSRRDQVDAQSCLTARLTSALVRADPDALESPTRRDTRGLLGGLVLAALMLAGVAGWAYLSPGGSTAWRAPGSLVVDRSSGAQYLFVGGVLRPVRNAASARLFVDGAVSPVVVAGSRLAGVPRGAPIGIPDGPEVLPPADALNTGVWRACAGDGTGAPIVVDIGSPRAPARIGPDESLFVSSEGREYLLWRGQRLAMTRPWVADVLGYGAATPIEVPAAWLELLAAGPDLAPVAVAGRGSPGRVVGGREVPVGEIFSIFGSEESTAYYILLADGLAPLTTIQLQLAQAEAGSSATRPATAADLVSVPLVELPEAQHLLPARPPALVEPLAGEAACAESPGVRAVPPAPRAGTGAGAAPARGAGGGETPEAGAGGLPPSAATDDTVLDLALAPLPAAAGAAGPDDAGQLPAAVQVRAGRGALLVPDADLPAEDQQSLLIDGSGTAFPLAPDAVEALGYRIEQAVAVPRQLPLLLPRGPTLGLIQAR
ncbi:type VII secretion protein EccB [Parafrankia sp. FMc2]|uniref:type VII secretion protein EccB n=1 Tax=Parafrankia sp. FMc2 TaxID=3233196 RepID=UPI0034D4B611